MFRKKFLLGTIFALFFVIVLLSFSFSYSANAEKSEETKQTSLISPNSTLCYADFKNAISVDCSGEICLISKNKIIVLSNSKYLEKERTSPKSIKRLDFNKLIFSDNGSLYSISYTENAFDLNANLLQDTNSNVIGCNYFDFNNNYLVTAYGTVALIYSRENGSLSFMEQQSFTVTTDTPICLNDNNELFYFLDGWLMKKQISDGTTTSITRASAKNIIANNNYVYLLNNDISFIDLNNETETFTIKSFNIVNYDNNYDLGSFGKPTAISFRNDNLIIADEKAIQEFEIENENLSFTGFSISKGNTAYNRISNSASDIAKSGNNIAVIDSKKITVIKNVKGEKTFVNYLISDLQIEPTKIILKQNTLIAYNDDYCITIDINTGEISNPKSITDYGLNSEWKDGTKTQYDIAKNKYTLEDGKIKINGVSYSLTLPAGLSVFNNNIKSFAMDFESKEIYFILENEEVILSSDTFDNKTISEMDLSSYNNSYNNADSIENLKVFTTNENCELYKVELNDNNKMTYLDFIDKNSYELVLIYSFENEYSDFYLLSGFDENNREMFVLSNKNNVNEVIKTKEDVSGTVYVTTPVDLYYLPIINDNRHFSLKDDGNIIRLTKETEINILKEVTVNNKVFYYGETEFNGTKHTGYIPKDFTVKALAKQYISQTFCYKKVCETKLYDQSGNYILTIENDSTIKLFESKEEKSYISFTDENGEHFGYIKTSDIISIQDNTIKIVVCILILLICVFITTIYFVFIKRYPTGKIKD